MDALGRQRPPQADAHPPFICSLLIPTSFLFLSAPDVQATVIDGDRLTPDMTVARRSPVENQTQVEPRQTRLPRIQHTRTRTGCERCRAQRRKCKSEDARRMSYHVLFPVDVQRTI